ncbi:putative efflux protein, MATE family [Butyrivibrio sp. ob235]|uniref:MATE family efflux transporter n=1 Tax=Butyrivibrio sp. ob235 TaxID=1761780 RepID=UPI0008D7E9FC|nr:MATE family efflux transporter [Butyrivibrio sp. ob235]SEM05636.1 putative efflux protein, MATE family [Butyrivibrio sp. ob235]
MKNTEVTAADAIKVKLPLKECLIGEAHFYKKVSMVVLPMIIQNTLSNVVGLLDNIMVGQVGTLAMSAVAIVNQLMFVFMLCVWGALAGAGIFGTQFFGKRDYEGVRITMRFKMIVALVISVSAIILFKIAGTSLIELYIAKETSAEEAAETMKLARNYLNILLVSLVPFGITQVYAGTIRESGKTTLPMVASMTAMIINFIFNYILIFGHFGFPKLGVSGAAIATVISRLVESSIVVFRGHLKKAEYEFLKGLYKNFHVPVHMIWPILSKSFPLLVNECLWSLGQAVLLQSYSMRGIEVIAAMNIANTIAQIFNEVFLSLGNSTSIVVGQELGAEHYVKARIYAWRMAALSITSCIIMGSLLFLVSPVIPQIYNTEPEIRNLATEFIRIVACVMPVNAFANVSYFTLRSGGKTLITFLFDSCFTWAVSVPVARVLAGYTVMAVTTVYFCVCALELIKSTIGFILVKKGVWVKNIVKNA